MTIEEWNEITKDEETDVKAVNGDCVVEIDRVAFLIQRKNNWNNLVCIRTAPSKTNIVQTFEKFRSFCEHNEIQYLRIEGHGKHHYKMLNLLYKYSPEGAGLAYAVEESKECKSNIWYVKTY
jgi:hypothetical protein